MLKRDYARAELELRNAIQVMPADAEPYYQIALAYLGDGKVTDAVVNLQKATELNPRHTEAQVKLAQLMALSGVHDAAQEGEKRMQDVLRISPQNVDALDALALNEFQLGKQQDAEQHLREALDKSPQNVKSWVALAQVHLKEGNLTGAEEVLQTALTKAPQSVELFTGLGDLYLMSGRVADADKQFRAALKIDPRFPLALFGLASAQLRQGRKDLAEQTYATVAALGTKEYRPLHAAFLFQEGKRDSAIHEFEALAKRYPDDRELRTKLVDAYFVAGRVADAEKVLTAALQSNPKDSDALLQQSSMLLRSGKTKEAENDLIQVSLFQTGSPQVHYLLAEVYEARGDTLRQRHELNEALRLAPTFLAARIQLAQATLAAGSAKEAMPILDAAPKEQKLILAYVIQRNWTLLALNDRMEARKWIDQGLKAIRTPELLLQDAALKLAEQNYGGARASAEEALKQSPEDVRALRVLCASYVGQKQPAEAIQRLEEYAAQHPGSVRVKQFLGEWLVNARQPDKARPVFAAIQTADPHYEPAGLALAKLDVNAGNLEAARKELSALVASDGENLEARQWLASTEMALSDYDGAAQQYREILQKDPDNLLALNDLAYTLGNFTNETDEALGYAQKALEASPDNVDMAGTLGWLLYRKGVYAAALAQLQNAVQKDGKSSAHNAVVRKYHLAMVYFKTGDRQRGMGLLSAALKLDPKLPEARMATLEAAAR